MERSENKYETEDSEFLHHAPCPSCDSSDNLGVYTDHEYCFGCGYHKNTGGKNKKQEGKKQKVPEGLIKGTQYNDTRGLSLTTVKKFGYQWGSYKGKGCYIAPYKDEQGIPVIQKLRFKDKKFKVLGKSKRVPLFGQHLWSGKGKKVVVTEGEIDAMSLSQLQGNKWPVVSIGSGATGARKHLKMNLEWLEGYDEIVLMFDNDKAGREAAQKCATLFTPGKCSIATLPMKDVNELLEAGRGQEAIKAMWDAKPFRPDGIIKGEDTWDILNTPITNRPIPTPWPETNEKMHGGPRTGEITMVCAGTGIGKSQWCRQFAWHVLKEGEKVAYIALEETVKRSVQGILSLEVEQPLHLENTVTDKELKDAWESTINSRPIYFYDHWGSADSDNLLNKIRYLAKGCDVSVVILDHISIVVSDIEGGDERRIIDNLMTKLATLVVELGIALVIVCHLKKPNGKSHEEGGQVTLDDLRGSGSLKQLTWTVIGLERDQQGDDPCVAGVRILKNRTVGETGFAGYIKYNPSTTMLNEHHPEFDEDDDEEEDEDI